MMMVSVGQCGLCTHFGEHARGPRLIEILSNRQASEDLVTECGHPKLADLHLRVSAVSGCDGFEQAG